MADSVSIPAGFPDDFLWGAATASYQVEGAAKADGRGMSIWDTFSHTPGKTAHGHTGDVACDQYHRYAEDVALMRDIDLGAYRFSIAWPRIFPEGSGDPNPEGFDYYHRLIDALLEAGIQPAVTLYHWDLPQTLEDAGGWPRRETALRFADYAAAVFDELGDKVGLWMTLNEPACSAYLGYMHGVHAPGRTDAAASWRAVHHLNLAHGLGVQAFRASRAEGSIGLAHNAEPFRPATRRDEDVYAADRAQDGQTRMFLGPVFGRGYPERHLEAHPDRPMPIEDGDMETIASPIDMLGINLYWERAVRHDPDAPDEYAMVPTAYPKTAMGWDITPWGIYNTLRQVEAEYDPPPLYVTENGCASGDRLSDDGTRIHDADRVAFLRAYLGECARAIRDGVDLRGYFLWSLIDNFEWAYGFTKRFGMVYCDYVDQRRVPKDSYYFYREVIAGHERF